ncbi:hypothetical protein GF407_08305 [candidate division KSB1 bacterium]|nr:hypothetical protein [candidate division KSB1 bacterium]
MNANKKICRFDLTTAPMVGVQGIPALDILVLTPIIILLDLLLPRIR